ncbi:hypothetical protein LCGC14_1038190 [marine sediment metagenome]|uniref:Uncharacterized protein n=1 Tax=marine sediment metagenome TaxID=412755 RepID=A0A0F9NE93_9ZZZZ
MAATLLPLLALIAFLATRKDDPTTAAPALAPPVPPPQVGIPPGTTFPTPGFVPSFPSGDPPPLPGDISLGVIPGMVPGATSCAYSAAVETPDIAFQEFAIGTLPSQLMGFQDVYESGLLTWFNSTDLPPGFWMLLRNCGGIGSIVIATRLVPGAPLPA